MRILQLSFVFLIALFGYTLFADNEFEQWKDSFRPYAIEQGISEATLNLALRGLLPDQRVLHLDSQTLIIGNLLRYGRKKFTINTMDNLVFLEDEDAFVLLPAGYRGPAFLAFRNFKVLLQYNAPMAIRCGLSG